MPEKQVNITFVSHRFDDRHVVWFGATRSFVLLEEPAWIVFKRFVSGRPGGRSQEYLAVRILRWGG